MKTPLSYLKEAFPVYHAVDSSQRELVSDNLKRGCGICYQPENSDAPFCVYDYDESYRVTLGNHPDAEAALNHLISHLQDKPGKVGLLMRLLAFKEKYYGKKKSTLRR